MATNKPNIDVGDEVPPLEWLPTREFVQEMMSLSGWLAGRSPMSGPNRFTDPEAARREGFGGTIVPGNMGTMAMSMAVYRWIPGAFIKKLDCVFRQPLPQGQKVTATGVVTDRREEEGETVLELDLYLVREDGQRPQGGTCIVVLPKNR